MWRLALCSVTVLAAGCGDPDPGVLDAMVPADSALVFDGWTADGGAASPDCPSQSETGCGPWFGEWFEQVFDAGDLGATARLVDVSGAYVLGQWTGAETGAFVLAPDFLSDWESVQLAEVTGDGADLVPVAIAYCNLDGHRVVGLLCDDGAGPSQRQCWIYEVGNGFEQLAPSDYEPTPIGIALDGITFVGDQLYLYGDGVYRYEVDHWQAVVAAGTGSLRAAGGSGDWDAAAVLVGDGGRMLVHDDGVWQARETGVEVDLHAVSVRGQAMVAGGDDGVLLVGDLASTNPLATCSPGDTSITDLLLNPWGGEFFLGVAGGTLFGAQDDQLCLDSPPSPGPFVALSHDQDGTCVVLHAITATAVYREPIACTE